jgi:hypothetical protein
MRASLLVIAFVTSMLFAVSLGSSHEADAAGVYGNTCTNAATWTADQCDNSYPDDTDNNSQNFSGACYGYCGPGCSLNCGYGSYCGTHDYYTRRDGMWSANAMAAFPPAAVQWGKCVMSSGATAASGYIKSAWSGIKKSVSSVVSSIFN